MKRLYYAHSKIIYDTPREGLERGFLEDTFKNICCPNRDIGEQSNFEIYLREVRKCSGLVCSEYMGHIGHGVFTEVVEALRKKKKVFCLRCVDCEFTLDLVAGVKIVDEDDWKVEYGKVILKYGVKGVASGRTQTKVPNKSNTPKEN